MGSRSGVRNAHFQRVTVTPASVLPVFPALSVPTTLKPKPPRKAFMVGCDKSTWAVPQKAGVQAASTAIGTVTGRPPTPVTGRFTLAGFIGLAELMLRGSTWSLRHAKLPSAGSMLL